MKTNERVLDQVLKEIRLIAELLMGHFQRRCFLSKKGITDIDGYSGSATETAELFLHMPSPVLFWNSFFDRVQLIPSHVNEPASRISIYLTQRFKIVVSNRFGLCVKDFKCLSTKRCASLLSVIMNDKLFSSMMLDNRVWKEENIPKGTTSTDIHKERSI